jgi:hypothetical protein
MSIVQAVLNIQQAIYASEDVLITEPSAGKLGGLGCRGYGQMGVWCAVTEHNTAHAGPDVPHVLRYIPQYRIPLAYKKILKGDT